MRATDLRSMRLWRRCGVSRARCSAIAVHRMRNPGYFSLCKGNRDPGLVAHHLRAAPHPGNARAKDFVMSTNHPAAAEQDAFEREVSALRRDFAKLKLDYELRCFQQKYSPDQPRSPKGNPDGGQWIRDASKDGVSSTSGSGSAQSTDISAAKKMPAIVKEFGKWTARQYVSRYCEARINRELPGQFEDMTISDIWNIAKGGDARARTCLKLLNSGRFRK